MSQLAVAHLVTSEGHNSACHMPARPADISFPLVMYPICAASFSLAVIPLRRISSSSLGDFLNSPSFVSASYESVCSGLGLRHSHLVTWHSQTTVLRRSYLMNMAAPEASSIEWFVMYMRLHNHGVIPTVTPLELMPTRPHVAEFMGPKQGSGYAFNNHGSPEYEEYVRELLVRVLQINWPVNNIMPFHFARGLTSEARGTEVNWAEFAFKVTHPHQSRLRIPRVLEAFSELQAPLHPLFKVIPPGNSGSIRLDRYFNRQHFHLPQTRNITTPTTLVDPVVEDADATPTPRSPPAGHFRIKYARRADVSVNLEVGEPSARKSEKASTGRLGRSENGVMNIVPALCAVRPGIIQLVEAEQRRLQETRNMAYSKVTSGETRYREEKEKAQQIATKIEEKLVFQRRAVHEYERARRVLVTAIINVGNGIAVDGKVPPNNMIHNSESLVNSWYENVRIARHRLQEWELKSERQSVIVGRLNEELKQAENEYRSICETLDVQLAEMKAITDLLEDVKKLSSAPSEFLKVQAM